MLESAADQPKRSVTDSSKDFSQEMSSHFQESSCISILKQELQQDPLNEKALSQRSPLQGVFYPTQQTMIDLKIQEANESHEDEERNLKINQQLEVEDNKLTFIKVYKTELFKESEEEENYQNAKLNQLNEDDQHFYDKTEGPERISCIKSSKTLKIGVSRFNTQHKKVDFISEKNPKTPIRNLRSYSNVDQNGQESSKASDTQSYKFKRDTDILHEFSEENLAAMKQETRIFQRFMQHHYGIKAKALQTKEFKTDLSDKNLVRRKQLCKDRKKRKLDKYRKKSKHNNELLPETPTEFRNHHLSIDDFNGDDKALIHAQRFEMNLTQKILKNIERQESKQKVKQLLEIGLILFLNLINILACITFVIGDYYEQGDRCDTSSCRALDKIDLTVCIIFTLEFGYNFYLHPKPKLSFLFRYDTCIDLLTILPPWINIILATQHKKANVNFLRILRIFKILRIFRMYKQFKRIKKNTNEGEEAKEVYLDFSPVHKQVLTLIMNLVMTLFVTAGIVMFIDNQWPNSFTQEMKFMDAVYYMIVTASSMGYGDIVPQTFQSRVSIIFIILTIISIFGSQISQLSSTIRENDQYDTVYKFKGHIIILGTMKVSILSRFLLHFFQQQTMNENQPKCIIIGEQRITQKMKRLISFHLFEEKVFYLSVKSIDKVTLKKAAFDQCAAIFYLTNQYDSNPDVNDKKALFLNQFFINNSIYCNMYMQLSITDCSSFVKINYEEGLLNTIYQNKREVKDSQAPNKEQNHILSVNLLKIKFQILAHSIFNDGMLAFYNNWFLNDQELYHDEGDKNPSQLSGLQELAQIYQQTIDYKCFQLLFPSCFLGKTYQEAVMMVNKINLSNNPNLITKCILIGLRRIPLLGNKNHLINNTSPTKLRRSNTDFQWDKSQQMAEFHCEDYCYIINTPQTTIIQGDHALLLAACDDITLFFTEDNLKDLIKTIYTNEFQNSELQQTKNFVTRRLTIMRRSNTNKINPSSQREKESEEKNLYESVQTQRNLITKEETLIRQEIMDQVKDEKRQSNQKRKTNNRMPSQFKDNQSEQQQSSSSSFKSSSSEQISQTFESSNSEFSYSESETEKISPLSRKRFAPKKKSSKIDERKQSQYKKILSNLDRKCDEFICQGLLYQLKKSYDYKCLLPAGIIDISQVDLKGKIFNHVLICGFQHGLEYFIEAVRQKSDIPLCWIDDQGNEQLFMRLINKYKNVFLLQGSSLEIQHLKNANLKDAQIVIVLAQNNSNSPFRDADAIMITKLIKELTPNKKVITEITEISHLPMIEESLNNQDRSKASPFLSKDLLQGKIFFSAQLDVLSSYLCSEPHSVKVFLKLLQNKMPQQKQQDQKRPTLKDLKKRSDEKQKSHSSDKFPIQEPQSLISLRVPGFIDGYPYWQLFEELYEQRNVLMIGIFSRNIETKDVQENQELIDELFIDDSLSVEELKDTSKVEEEELQWFDIDFEAINGNVPILITNPPAQTLLRKGDHVIALGNIDIQMLERFLKKKNDQNGHDISTLAQNFENGNGQVLALLQMQKNGNISVSRGQKNNNSTHNLKKLGSELLRRIQDNTFQIENLQQQNMDIIEEISLMQKKNQNSQAY